MPAVGVIDMVTWKTWTPIGKQPDKTAIVNVLLHGVMKRIGDAEPVQRRFYNGRAVIENKVSLDAHFARFPILEEPPSVEASGCRRTIINTLVGG